MQRTYEKFNAGKDSETFLLVASFLDPRREHLSFLTPDDQKDCHKDVKAFAIKQVEGSHWWQAAQTNAQRAAEEQKTLQAQKAWPTSFNLHCLVAMGEITLHASLLSVLASFSLVANSLCKDATSARSSESHPPNVIT
jgi:hypothetical protein